jgi:hypothetical protein
MSCDQIFGCCKLRCCPTHLTPKKENWFECISCKQSASITLTPVVRLPRIVCKKYIQTSYLSWDTSVLDNTGICTNHSFVHMASTYHRYNLQCLVETVVHLYPKKDNWFECISCKQSARIAPAPVVRIPTPPTPLPEQNEAIALQPSQTDTVDYTCGKCMSCEQIFGCFKLGCCPTHLTPKKDNRFECISCKQSATISFCSRRAVGDKCIGQHRNLHQPKFCSHGKHLPQVQSTVSD